LATLDAEHGVRGTTWRIRFLAPGNRRVSVRLGKVPKRTAESAKLRIELLVAAKVAGHSIDTETAIWVASLGDHIHARLVKAGLVESRERSVAGGRAVVRLGDHIDRYIQSRAKLKPNTLRNYHATKRLLTKYFGADEPVEAIHAGRARDYRERLANEYAPATVAREIKRARQFFEYAKDCKIIPENPFARIRAGSQRNTSRKYFVSREVIDAVLAACPDNEWRLIVVLARYAGLRIPSELEELTWARIDWEQNRFTVIVKKKEHIDGHGTRVVPIFPEIRPSLEQARAEAPAESIYVVPRGRTGNVNLRTGLFKIMARAGVAPWPKLFVNLRASRETELMRTEPAHVVHAWLGNSREVAEDHYLMVTDEDFERASRGVAGVQMGVRKGVTNSPGQKPGQSGAIRCNPERSSETKTSAHPADREVYRCSHTPTGSRTPVFGLRTRRPGPLDDGGVYFRSTPVGTQVKQT
jgi:integrase